MSDTSHDDEDIEASVVLHLRHFLRLERSTWERDDPVVVGLVDELSECLVNPVRAASPPLPPPPSRAEMAAERERRAEATDAKWSSTLARFEATQAKVQSKIDKQKEYLAREETKELRFKPAIDRKSRRIAHEFPSFLERQASAVAWRDKHMEAERDQKRLEEAQAVTTRPNLKAPCLCGQAKHTPVCRQFLDLCATTTRFEIQQKTHAMKRSVDDMLAYAQAKHERQVERVLEAHEKEAAQTPFAPTLNPRSLKIYEAMVQAGGKTRHRGDEPKSEEVPFRPRINSKSRALAAAQPASKTVFERLEAHADARQLKLAQVNVSLVDTHVRNVKHVGKDDLQLQRVLNHLSPKGKGQVPPITTIVAGPDHAFILDNFTSDTSQPQLLGLGKTDAGIFKAAGYDTPGTHGGKKGRVVIRA
ncbi:hypothetical protein ACHHYP_07696 [Achlya hypogyna]|uniref:Uncharacterized protein n=1 Tax=Achlya hypogyna TaxID=1202772 RepID=A0A1V9YQR9_ACHHY|nr:hypothetical protein ACHHYP_07696 [Achlya hypogyna]